MAVTDLWHKTLVYFGMADERGRLRRGLRRRDASARDERERDRAQSSRRTTTSSAPTASAPTCAASAPAAATPTSTTSSPRSSRAGAPPGDALGRVAAPSPSEVHLVVPKSFNDAQQIADKFKGTVPVILNLQSAETDLAKRLIDFSSGLTYALDGGMQRVADKVFMLTPRNVEVSAEERARLLEKGFFNQY